MVKTVYECQVSTCCIHWSDLRSSLYVFSINMILHTLYSNIRAFINVLLNEEVAHQAFN